MTWDKNTIDRTITVRVNGVERPVDQHSVTWAQDITSDLPAAVTAGGQVAHRTGTITWRTEGISTLTPSPWYAGPTWIPTVGNSVTIDVTDGAGNTHRVFTGVIETVEGDAHGNRSSKIVAPLRGENRIIRRLAQTQVGALPGGSVGRFATTPVWIVSETAREMGYASVPPAPPPSKLILDAPLQGSTYNYSLSPYINAQMVTSHRPGFPNLPPVWHSGRDGFGISDALLEWEPHTGGGTGAGAVGVSILVYDGHAADALLRIRHGIDADTYLRVLGGKTVRVSTFVSGSIITHDLTTPLPVGEGPHRVSAVYRGGQIHVRIAGAEHTVSAPTPSPAVTSLRLEAGAGSCVAGLQVWHPSTLTDHHAPTWTPTAFYRYGAGTQGTVLAPSIRDERAKDVLSDFADALLSPMWIDGQGMLQIATGKSLHDQSPALTVDALADVSELSYSMALLDHRPTVEVTYAHAHESNIAATVVKTIVWQGSGANVEQDNPDQTFVEIPDDEEWIGLSDPAGAKRLVPDTVQEFNQANGSWWGIAGAEEDDIASGGGQVVETLTPWTWKVTTTAPVLGGKLHVSEAALTGVHPRFRGMNLPIYRARALVRYEDRTVSAATPGATQQDGVLTHDTGKWITTTSAATQLAQWVHSMVGTTTPILEGLRVRFDPQLDVGVKVRVRAQRVFGVDFQALILSVDHEPGSDTTTVVARVTQVISYASGDTIDAVDYAHLGQSLAAWDQARAGRTLDQVAAQPYL